MWGTIKIISTNVEGFKSIGADRSVLVALATNAQSSCRRFSRLEVEEKEEEDFDLFFVAPLQADFDISYTDVKQLFPQSNRMNTYFFSEYNDSSRKKFDFPTGVGGRRMGLFLTSTRTSTKNMRGPYAMTYLADIPRAQVCFTNFLNMVCKKYHRRYRRFQIVVPSWIAAQIIDLDPSIRLDGIAPYFGRITVVTKEKEKEKVQIQMDSRNKNTLIIRGDVYPLNNRAMVSLMKYSVRDILLTGDQSITDMCRAGRKKIYFTKLPLGKKHWRTNWRHTCPTST